MIEIFKRDGIWIATYQGGIIEYDKDLKVVLEALARRSEEFECKPEENI